MPADYASSIQAVAIRVCALTAAGASLSGADTCYVTGKFTRISFTPEYEEGEEVQEKAADGSICVYYKMPDTLKHANVEVAVCNPQPEITALLAGGATIISGDVVGYKAPVTGVDGTPNGVALEAWSRAIVAGKPASTNPYWRWVFPFGKYKMTGERALENGLMANAFEGRSEGNAAYNTGPVAPNWVYGTDRAFQYARVSAAPTGVNDYVVVP